MTSPQVLLFLAASLLSSFPVQGSENEDIAAMSTSQKHIQQEIVDKHNALRKAVSPSASDMLKMEWSNEAAARAQMWANECNYRHSEQEFRRTNISCGENLYMSTHTTSWSTAIQNWYDERKNFVYGTGSMPFRSVTGHYTQVVWNTSSRVGCAVAYCPQQFFKVFMVCHYCPAGNYLRRIIYPYTSGQPCAKCPGHCDDGLCTNSCAEEDTYSICADLIKSPTCNYPAVKEGCKASCNCKNKIY